MRDCKNRPRGMDVETWCAQNNITKANYYYRLRRVRKACLDQLQTEQSDFIELPMTSEKKAEENKPEYIEKNDEVEIKKADEDVAPILKKDLYISNIKYKFIGIAFSSYIIVEIENELYIINQQSANEVLKYLIEVVIHAE